MTIDVFQLPVWQDNYIYILHDTKAQKTLCVDPAESETVLSFLTSKGWGLDYILNTHHHPDHVGGNEALKAATNCQIIGFQGDQHRIPALDKAVVQGDVLTFLTDEIEVIETFGHTNGHISYFFRQGHLLFCGDTLFSIGCGRLFEGTPGQMWASLQKLRSLPQDTKIYCAHEYTRDNLKFACALEPDNPLLSQYLVMVENKRAQNLPTVPSLLSQECQLNPFLRADDPNLQAAVNMSEASDEEVFAHIRHLKDVF